MSSGYVDFGAPVDIRGPGVAFIHSGYSRVERVLNYLICFNFISLDTCPYERRLEQGTCSIYTFTCKYIKYVGYFITSTINSSEV